MNELLTSAANTLDEAANLVHSCGFESEDIRKIGVALAEIFEIRHKIYEEMPELTPPHLVGVKFR